MNQVEECLLLRRIPDAIRGAAKAQGIGDEDCLFSLQSDLSLEGERLEVWLVVTRTHVLSVKATGEGGELERGPFPLAHAEKVREFQTVGSAFLQLLMHGVYVDVVRISNARREIFNRARTQIERLIGGQPSDDEALTRPLENVCASCGLPLPGPGAKCARCESGHGIFIRSLALMKPYSRYIVFLLGMMLLRVLLGLIPPYLIRILVDRVLQAGGHIDWLTWIVGGLFCIYGFQCLLNITIGRTSSLVGTRITKELREMVADKLLSLNVEYHDKHSAGSLMSRVLYDVDYFHSFVNQVAEGFLLNIMMVVGIGAMLFYMNWRLALLVLLPIPFVVVGTTFFWKYIYPRYYRLYDSQSKLAQLVSGLLSGIKMVRAFGQERRELERFSSSVQYLRNSRLSLERSSATFHPIMAFVFSLGGLIVWYGGGHLVVKSAITLGTLMAFFGYLGMFYQPISSLSVFSNWMTGFLSAGQRVFEVLDENVSVTDDPDAVSLPDLAGGIEFKNVVFGYDQYSPILKGVSLKIEPGQFIGIVGKSGSGKTTLVNLICRFYDAQQGEILVDGVDIRKIRQRDLHQNIALVLQEPFLFRASVKDNIVYGRPEADDIQIVEAARAANAHEFIARLHFSYDQRLGERGAGLSGGERQRVTIARALIRNPKILILDEATSSVDTESEQEIQQALATFGKGRTTIAIAHRLSTLKSADYIYVLDDGRIAEEGSHEALMEQNGIYATLVRIQTELTRLEVD